MKKIVITGAAGFIGSRLARQLIPEQCLVIGIDNLQSGLMANMKDLLDHPRFKFICADVSSNSIMLREELDRADEIYHLASPASPKFYQSMPFDTIAVNTLGTKNMLELARTTGAKLLYSSTSEAYGDPLVHPQDEQYSGNVNTWGPRACYDESKRLGEVFCYEYFTRFGVAVKVARIFNTYSAGLRSDDGRILSNFISQALTGLEITVYGNGMQTRSFCYLDDTVAGLKLMMEKDAANGEIINIGNPKEYTVLEVARLVKQLTGSASPIVFLPLPKDDPKRRRPSIDKAKRLLGWQPQIELEEGIERMIKDYRQRLAEKGKL
ncbi:NAD-dependent epimerase/dehydratase family protein [Paenibacillus alkalitolerans]|uniref:NAD-dependent epimerase/dehydratase family protein n=1 Tax=Paenibacillus alkalitolerans TaxID=2799335 RepID=UPI0018F29F87|nr:NAD-dependent epimerase/dehydratase family protein [Paenibacillus alkalitolerans]